MLAQPRLEEILVALEGWGERYQNEVLIPHLSGILKVDNGREAVRAALTEPTNVLKAIYGYFLFVRSGGENVGYNHIALSALDSFIRKDDASVFDPGRRVEPLWSEFVAGCNARGIKTNEKLNRPAVLGVLDLARDLAANGNNIVSWITSSASNDGSVRDCHFRLFRIGGVGPKIASFFIRDIVAIHGLEDKVSEVSRPFLQPIDRWVYRASVDLFYPNPKTLLGKGLSSKVLMYPVHVAQTIVENCERNKVSPIKFNQGAYYLGSESADEESFHDSLLRARAH